MTNTQWQPTVFFPKRRGTNSYVLLLSKVCILVIMACYHPRKSSASVAFLGIVRDRRNKGKIGKETACCVTKKIVDRIRIISRVSILANDNRPTQTIMIRSCDNKIWLRKTSWREFTLWPWTSHLVPVLIGNKRWFRKREKWTTRYF